MRRWTPAEDATLLRMVAEGVPDEAIAAALERSIDAVQTRRHTLRSGGVDVPFRPAARPPKPATQEPPAHVLEEYERAANAPRSLTAIICGDPLPGRSALDKRVQNRVPNR